MESEGDMIKSRLPSKKDRTLVKRVYEVSKKQFLNIIIKQKLM
jgi:hypothetical protein